MPSFSNASGNIPQLSIMPGAMQGPGMGGIPPGIGGISPSIGMGGNPLGGKPGPPQPGMDMLLQRPQLGGKNFPFKPLGPRPGGGSGEKPAFSSNGRQGFNWSR